MKGVAKEKRVGKKARRHGEPKDHYYKGKRVIQHLRLPDELRDSMQARAEKHEITYYEEWDRAAVWWLVHLACMPPVQYEAPRGGRGVRLKKNSYKTVWIKQELVEKLRRIADRDGVKLARVIHTVGVRYLQSDIA